MAPRMIAWRPLLAAGALGAAAPHLLMVHWTLPSSTASWCWKTDEAGAIIQNEDQKQYPVDSGYYTSHLNKCCTEGETEATSSHTCFEAEECGSFVDAKDNVLKDVPADDPKRPTSCAAAGAAGGKADDHEGHDHDEGKEDDHEGHDHDDKEDDHEGHDHDDKAPAPATAPAPAVESAADAAAPRAAAGAGAAFLIGLLLLPLRGL